MDLASLLIPQTYAAFSPLLSSPLLSSESWGLHTSIQKAAWQELSPPQGKVQIFCGGGVKGNRGAGKIGHSTS